MTRKEFMKMREFIFLKQVTKAQLMRMIAPTLLNRHVLVSNHTKKTNSIPTRKKKVKTF